MAAKQYILSLDDDLYEFDAVDARPLNGIRGRRGRKMVFCDFEAAVPRVATVEARPNYAHAVLEKELRESGEIEPGGRVIVLFRRRRGQRSTELLYITTPAAVAIESELERDQDGGEYLLFPVQKLFVQVLAQARPQRPLAVLLVSDRHIDVVVADRHVLYGSFRVSALKAGSNPELLEKNFKNALQAVEREFSIDIGALHCLHLFSRMDTGYDWIEAIADTHGIGFTLPRVSEIRIDDVSYRCSVLSLLHRARVADSCSPPSVVVDHRANELLPWAAAATVACCAVALFFIAERQYRADQVTDRIAVVSSNLTAQLDSRPAPIPAYQPYLETADKLVYARKVPSLGQVLGDLTRAAANRSTIMDQVEVAYEQDRIVLNLTGRTDKAPDHDNRLAFYNSLITDFQGAGYALAGSALNTDTQRIAFTVRLERRLDKERT